MKIISSVCTVLICAATLLSPSANASSFDGEQFQYNPAQFQQVCKGKSDSQPTTVTIHHVLFNGTCQVMLVPNNRQDWRLVEDHVLVQACDGKRGRIRTSLDGHESSGKCAKSFDSIEPAAQ